MQAAFNPKAPDFSGIAPGLIISAARQKTFVEVNEEGTEAVAVTGLTVSDSTIMMPSPDPYRMNVDRSLLFFIEVKMTGMILFIGTVFDPQPN